MTHKKDEKENRQNSGNVKNLGKNREGVVTEKITGTIAARPCIEVRSSNSTVIFSTCDGDTVQYSFGRICNGDFKKLVRLFLAKDQIEFQQKIARKTVKIRINNSKYVKTREEQGRSCYGTNKGTNYDYNRGTAVQRIREFQFNGDKFIRVMLSPCNTSSVDFAMKI